MLFISRSCDTAHAQWLAHMLTSTANSSHSVDVRSDHWRKFRCGGRVDHVTRKLGQQFKVKSSRQGYNVM